MIKYTLIFCTGLSLFGTYASLGQTITTQDGKQIPLTGKQWKESAEKAKQERLAKEEARKKANADKLTDQKKAIEDKIEAEKQKAKNKREAADKERKDKANKQLNKIGLQMS